MVKKNMKPSDTQLLTSRLATTDDLNIIATIISACSSRLKGRQLPDWSNYYHPSRVDEKLKTQLAYLFYLDTVPVGVVFISENDLYYYEKSDIDRFTGSTSPALYISTLAVNPEYQHRGFASQIIAFCEKLSIQKKIPYLRLDCNSRDLPLVDFYRRRGFVTIGPMDKEPEYLLLEKTIL